MLLVVPSPVGGTPQYTHNLANSLAARGHAVQVAAARGGELADFRRCYRLLEVFDRLPRPHRVARFLLEAARFRPDIVHLQGAQHPEFYLAIWALLRIVTGARFVWTPQDVLSNVTKAWHARLYRALYARMDHVFLNARHNLAAVCDAFGLDRARATVLPIPDLLAFIRQDVEPVVPPVPPGRRLVLCFGLIEPRKGIDTLIEAFALLRAKRPEAYLLVVGKPLVDPAPLAGAIARHGLEGDAALVPRYASFGEMAGLFGAAAVVVLPYHDGWNSGVLAAALGFGRPVVVTDVGGFPEVVGPSGAGLVVPPRDAAALAGALDALLGDEARRTAMAAAAARAAGTMSWDMLAERIEAAYDSVLGARDRA